MTRSERMSTVHGFASEKANRIARDFAEARDDLELQKQRLEQLINFRQDYQSQLSDVGAKGMGAFRLRDYNAFISRIDAAIEEQRERVYRAEQYAETKRREWLAQQTHATAIEKVVDRYRDQERREVERQEQRDTDELAQQRHAHKRKDER